MNQTCLGSGRNRIRCLDDVAALVSSAACIVQQRVHIDSIDRIIYLHWSKLVSNAAFAIPPIFTGLCLVTVAIANGPDTTARQHFEKAKAQVNSPLYARFVEAHSVAQKQGAESGFFLSVWSHLDAAVTRTPAYREALSLGSRISYDVRDWDRLFRYSDSWARHFPKDDQAFGFRAIAHAVSGRTIEALKDYSIAISLNEEEFAYFYNRGRLREQRGNLQAACVDYGTAVRLNPNWEQGRNELRAIRAKLAQSGGTQRFGVYNEDVSKARTYPPERRSNVGAADTAIDSATEAKRKAISRAREKRLPSMEFFCDEPPKEANGFGPAPTKAG